MRKILLVILAMTFAAGAAYAQGCEGCNAVKVWGYMAPNFRMTDQGEYLSGVDDQGEPIYDDYVMNKGFGMAYCRFVFTGEVGAGEIVKKISWRVETDISEPGLQGLQYAWLKTHLSDQFSVLWGRTKMPYSLETLYSTPGQITADRHLGQHNKLGYGGYGYGAEGHFKHEMFNVQFGVYDGTGSHMNVADQDPALTLGLRGVLTPPVEGLELGANVVMVGLPQPYPCDEDGVFMWDGDEYCVHNQGEYFDDKNNKYHTNSGLAFGVDAQFKKDINEEMSFFGQAEFGTGDNWLYSYMGELVPSNWKKLDEMEQEGKDYSWEDFEWYSFQYFYLKAMMKITKDLGFQVGFSQYDPNTESDDKTGIGMNDEITKITPGLSYWWSKALRTIVEVQMVTKGGGVEWDDDGDKFAELDDDKFTHFVIQQVLIWP